MASVGFPSVDAAPELRSMNWFMWSGALRKKQNSCITYADLHQRPERDEAGVDANVEETSGAQNSGTKNDDVIELCKALSQIELDLDRTWPENPYFLSKHGKSQLRRMLKAWSVYRPKVGYYQSMNFVAAFLLVTLPSEEDAFWLMAAVFDDLLPAFYTPDMAGIRTLVDKFSVMLAHHLPGFHKSSQERYGIPSGFRAYSWFLSLFFSTIKPETLARVWDFIFYQYHCSRSETETGETLTPLGVPVPAVPPAATTTTTTTTATTTVTQDEAVAEQRKQTKSTTTKPEKLAINQPSQLSHEEQRSFSVQPGMGLEDFGLLEGGLGADELAMLFRSPTADDSFVGSVWGEEGAGKGSLSVTKKKKVEVEHQKKNNLSVEAVLCCVGLALLKLKEPRMIAAADCLQAGTIMQSSELELEPAELEQLAFNSEFGIVVVKAFLASVRSVEPGRIITIAKSPKSHKVKAKKRVACTEPRPKRKKGFFSSMFSSSFPKQQPLPAPATLESRRNGKENSNKNSNSQSPTKNQKLRTGKQGNKLPREVLSPQKSSFIPKKKRAPATDPHHGRRKRRARTHGLSLSKGKGKGDRFALSPQGIPLQPLGQSARKKDNKQTQFACDPELGNAISQALQDFPLI